MPAGFASQWSYVPADSGFIGIVVDDAMPEASTAVMICSPSPSVSLMAVSTSKVPAESVIIVEGVVCNCVSLFNVRVISSLGVNPNPAMVAGSPSE